MIDPLDIALKLTSILQRPTLLVSLFILFAIATVTTIETQLIQLIFLLIAFPKELIFHQHFDGLARFEDEHERLRVVKIELIQSVFQQLRA